MKRAAIAMLALGAVCMVGACSPSGSTARPGIVGGDGKVYAAQEKTTQWSVRVDCRYSDAGKASVGEIAVDRVSTDARIPSKAELQAITAMLDPSVKAIGTVECRPH